MAAAIRLLTVLFLTACSIPAAAGEAGQVTIGFQRIYNPWKTVIADRILEKQTGYEINWRVFESGGEVVDAMAGGEVDIALAGSAAIATLLIRGIDLSLFWIAEDIASAEALVVRNGSGIVAPQDLRGKRIAVPFGSTGHLHTLFLLQQFGIGVDQVQLLNMQPRSIVSAWERGDVDASFAWHPALGQLENSGKVLLTSGLLSGWGMTTFDGMVVVKRWAAENPEFMVRLVRQIAAADESYRSSKEAWTAESEPVQKIIRVVGGDPADVPGVLEAYEFPTLEEQASERWLGGGAGGGAARALFLTSTLLRDEGVVDRSLYDFGLAVDPTWVERVLGR